MTHRSILSTLSICLVLAASFAACSDDPPAGPATTQLTLTGTAFDEQGYAVPHAVVEAVSATNAVIATDTTDETGAFVLQNVSALAKSTADVAVALRISHSDFKTKTIDLTPSSPMTVNMVHVDSACGSLSMLIRDVTTLAPLQDAEVKLRRNGVLVMTTLSDAQGRVSFSYLMAGQYSVRVAKAGFAVIERAVTIQYCDSTSLDLRMSASSSGGDTCCAGVLRITVKSLATNAVLTGAQVKLTRPGMDNRVQTSGNDGVVFRELCPGEYGVRIQREGYKVMEFNVTMGCNEPKEIEKYLETAPVDSCCNGVVTIVAKDSATNNPIANATVKLWRNGAIVATKTTDANGVALFEQRCEGSYGVSVLREGYKAREMSFSLGCDQQVSHTLLLKQNTSGVDSCCTAQLKIRAVDSTATTGGWIAGATVEIRLGSPTGPIVATGTTDVEGWYRKENLCSPAVYFVTVSKPGSWAAKTHDFNYTTCVLKTETFKLVP
jgi:large repetitive protein